MSSGFSHLFIRRACSERAVSILEVAIIFPLFLLLLLFFLFIGLGYNAEASVSNAVSTVRQAYSRGKRDLLGGANIFQELHDWSDGIGSNTNPPDRVRELLSTPDLALDPFATGHHYDKMAGDNFGVNFQDLPTHYILAHAFFLQSLKQSVGEVKFPCDPLDDVNGGPGCADCVNLSSSDWDQNMPGAPYDIFFDPNYDIDPVGIHCRYRPGSSLLGPIQGLIGSITGNKNFAAIIIERSYHFPRAN